MYNKNVLKSINLNNKVKKMRKFLIVSFLILLFIPYISINAQYGGFNDSPFKEGALVTAVKTGRLQDLVSALNSGASINERDFDEVPALLLAIERSRIDMTLFLLEQGARVNMKDQDNRTALSLAVFKDDPNLIKTLISYGADPNKLGPNRQTPLIIASREGKFNSVKALLQGGAYPDDTDLTGRTALDWAKSKRFKRIEILLIEHGAYNN